MDRSALELEATQSLFKDQSWYERVLGSGGTRSQIKGALFAKPLELRSLPGGALLRLVEAFARRRGGRVPSPAQIKQ